MTVIRYSEATKRSWVRRLFGLCVRVLLLPLTVSWRVGKVARGWFARLIITGATLASIVGAIIGVPGYLYYSVMAQRLDLTLVREMPERTVVVDCRGVELMQLHGEDRTLVSYDDVAPVFIDALLAREDTRFFDHGAVDWIAVARSIVRNLKDRSFTQGSSTLTMQLARNTFDLGGDNLHRKFLEVAVAQRIEREYSKQEILEHYMNRIFWGHQIRGVERASQVYFGKSASELELGEAAMLAGIIRGPNAFSPYRSMEKATRERDTTLSRMVATGKISEEVAKQAKERPLRVQARSENTRQENYAEAALRNELNGILEEKNIATGGLRVIATIDLALQRQSEASLERQLVEIESRPGYRHQTRADYLAGAHLAAADREPNYVQGAVVCMENHSGAVRAIVGGRNPNESEFDRAKRARRQVGSVFKPFVYATAFNKGLLPGSYVSDGAIERSEYDDLPANWSPSNSDGVFGGYLPAHQALVRSRNTPAIRVGAFSGLPRVRQMAERAGFLGEIPTRYSSFLGAFEATPLEVATAFTTFPNGGVRPRPFLIKEIRDRHGELLYHTGPLHIDVYSRGATWVTAQILQGVTKQGGTAAAVQQLGFTAPCGGKTGTTDGFTNAWFAGFTSHLSCCVWVGMDRQSESIANGAYGSRVAVPVWVDIMQKASELGYPSDTIGVEPELESCQVCRFSAKLATTGCRDRGCSYQTLLPKPLVPKASCKQHPGKDL